MSRPPVVAIVGRPNVGKSTLFNRLLGSRRSIVHDEPGVTRDRIVGRAELGDGQVVELIDTGGLVLAGEPLGLNEQVLLAVEESDLLVLVVDGKEGLTAADEEVWQLLRRHQKPTVLAVNKADTRAANDSFGEFFRLGVGPQILLSAEHGAGCGELGDTIAELVPALPAEPPSSAPAVAIVGRPNVGKSSLLNRLVGENRALVSPVAGTTRDPVDTVVHHGDRSYLLVDTAGMRRRAKVSGTPEELAVMMARRQIARCEVAVLVIDASQGVTSGDLSIAGAIWEMGRAAVVAINKWDLLDADRRLQLERSWTRLDELLANPPRLNLSALTGRGTGKLFGSVDDALEGFRRSVGTGELNRLLEAAVRGHQPPNDRGRPWKLFYATQVSQGPPTFMLFANRTLPRSSSYRRYLENRLRAELLLPGVPMRLVVRRRS